MGLTRQAAQRQAAALADLGYLALSPDPGRRNQSLITFTDAGTALMAECRAILAGLDRRSWPRKRPAPGHAVMTPRWRAEAALTPPLQPWPQAAAPPTTPSGPYGARTASPTASRSPARRPAAAAARDPGAVPPNGAAGSHRPVPGWSRRRPAAPRTPHEYRRPGPACAPFPASGREIQAAARRRPAAAGDDAMPATAVQHLSVRKRCGTMFGGRAKSLV